MMEDSVEIATALSGFAMTLIEIATALSELRNDIED